MVLRKVASAIGAFQIAPPSSALRLRQGKTSPEAEEAKKT